MMTIHVQHVGDRTILLQQDFERLVGLARQYEEIKVQADAVDASPDTLRVAEQGGAYNFWKDEGEDIYTMDDGEPV